MKNQVQNQTLTNNKQKQNDKPTDTILNKSSVKLSLQLYNTIIQTNRRKIKQRTVHAHRWRSIVRARECENKRLTRWRLRVCNQRSPRSKLNVTRQAFGPCVTIGMRQYSFIPYMKVITICNNLCMCMCTYVWARSCERPYVCEFKPFIETHGKSF